MQATAIVEGFRLSPQQRRLSKLEGNFTSQLVLLLDGDLRADALREALEKVCARHESLRTTFRRLPGVEIPVQSVEEYLAPSWQIVEAAEVEELLASERERGFDYENGPLVRATLFVLSPERHVLSITLPALCADRRTLNNLFAELSKSYAGSETDRDPFQYIQFSEFQNSLDEEEDAAKGKEFWNKQDVSTAGVSLECGGLAPLWPRSSAFDNTAAPGRRTPKGRLRLTASVPTTSATVLLAAWQTLLWRLTQQPIAIGNVCEGRPYDLLHDAFGLFARVLPVCCQFTDTMRFDEVVTQIDRFQRESEEWQDYFDLDQATQSTLKYFPFGYEYAELPAPQHARGLKISVSDAHCDIEPFDLKLSCVVKGPALEVQFEYDSALFGDDYVRRLAAQFQTLLNAALANPETSVAELEIVSAAEQRQILFDWNKTKRDYNLEQCIHQLFEQQVERTPHAPAAVFQDQQLTFAELNHRANQLAHYLQSQGVRPETPVGICIESSLEMLTGVLGILKAGGAYVPLDPRNPQQRIDHLLHDAGISILLTREQLTQRRSESTANLESSVDPDNLAYIIYTSGSTGQPRGVMVQHRSVINLAAALHEEVYAGLGPALKVGLSAPLAFDASVKQLVQLLHGHTLYLLPEELRLDAVRALAYLDQQAIDVVDCTPAQLKLLLAAGLKEHARPKLMLVGGEALDQLTWSQLAEHQQTRFFNVYGPTECTVDATWSPVQTATQPTIGRPIPNAQTYILDKNLKPAGIHLTGELYIGGEGLARGYLNSPEKTAERFIPDGLSGQAGARLYRTGDLARYSSDGSIVFSGRNDSQVKLRGHRIELGEIEAVLNQHEQVRQAVVVARESSNAEVRLVGYVVAEKTVDVGELRRMLSERLPDYMLPSFLVVIDELPLTRNGKVDISALPPPEAARPSADEHYIAPRNEIEETITRVWQEVLGVERIGVNDNFFDAGGHSLVMVQVHIKLSEIFKKNIPIVEMFAKPTISALAEYFSDTNGHKPSFAKTMDRAARRRQAASRRLHAASRR